MIELVRADEVADGAIGDRVESVRPAELRVMPDPAVGKVAAVVQVLGVAAEMGFADVVVIGLKPRGEGVGVLASVGQDVLRVLGALEMAKGQTLRMVENANGGGQ